MKLIPAYYETNDIGSRKPPLQSYLFGHRIQESQTRYEYLIEFLQVAISPKEIGELSKSLGEDYFPVSEDVRKYPVTYRARSRMGLKRFIFFPKSKLSGKAKVDQEAYEYCLKVIQGQIDGKSDSEKRETVQILQRLLGGFQAVTENRSWFDQNMLPVCPEVILPESMGVKSKRSFEFNLNDAEKAKLIDNAFDYLRYTYMARGGEVYYLHLLDALQDCPEEAKPLENLLRQMIQSYPQFSLLCNFIEETWQKAIDVPPLRDRWPNKKLGMIPEGFRVRNGYLISELKTFLSSRTHPFDKMETLSVGILLQLLRVMYLVSATEQSSGCWVIDVNLPEFANREMRKTAAASFRRNEESILHYLYQELDGLRDRLAEKEEKKIIENARNDSIILFRKIGKSIGIVIPKTGGNTRFSMSEEVVKFLVLSLIPPREMLTLDAFVEKLYEHFGMVIGPKEYRREMENGYLQPVSELSFLGDNLRAFAAKLKGCGFLRDLSDATSIVENPYDAEDETT